MRKVLCTLIVLAILAGMFVCLGAQAFAEGEGPKDLAVVAVAYESLSADQIGRIKESMADKDVLVIDINGLDNDGAGYDYAYVDMDQGFTPSGYEFIWPGKGEPTRTVTDNAGQECTVALLPIGPEDTVDSINAVVANYKQEGKFAVVIAVAPESCYNVQAAVDSNVDKVLTCGEPGVSSDKLVKVGGDSSAPVSVLVVDEMAGVEVSSMPMPEAADPNVGIVEPQVDDPGTGPVAETPQTYTITFQPGEGAYGEMAAATAEAGSSYALPQYCDFSRDGYSFIGWQIDGTDYQVFDPVAWTYTDQTITVTSDITAVALWQQQIQPVTVSFAVGLEGVEVTGSVDPATMDPGTEYTLPANGFSAAGYSFTGWDVNGESRQPGEKIIVDDYMTITALWELLSVDTDEPDSGSVTTVTVTYAPGEGGALLEGAYDSQSVNITVEGYAVPDGGAIFAAPEGKQFDGWMVEGDPTVYYFGDTYTLTGDVTFTAQWKDVEEPTLYAVTYFDGNGNSFSAQACAAGTVFNLPKPEDCQFVAPAGKQFSKWVFSDGVTTYDAGAAYTMPEGDVSFTAQWISTTATVTYMANNGAELNMAVPVDLVNGTAQYTLIALPAEFTAPENKTFAGWEIAENNVCQPGTTITVNGDMQILAKWTDVQKTPNQNPGPNIVGDLKYTQGDDTTVITLSYSNASIAAVFVDNAQLVADQDYTLGADGKSFTFINGYLNKLTVGPHTLNVTFQESDTATFISDPHTLTIAPVPATEQPQQTSFTLNWSDRNASVSQTFNSAPVKVEIDYGKPEGSTEHVFKEAVKDRDYTINGNTLTLLPALVNGNWGVWPNATYSLRVTLAGDASVISANGGSNLVTLQITLSGPTPTVQPTTTPGQTQAPGNPNVPVTGDETPITLYIVVLVVLIIALAGVLIFVMKRRSSGNRSRH